MTTKAIQTEGIALRRKSDASPPVFHTIAEVTGFQGPGGTAKVIDATSLDSTFIEKLMGLPDEGQVTFDVNLRTDDTTGQRGLVTDRAARTLRAFELVLTDSPPTTLAFSAYVIAFAISGTTNDKVIAKCTLEISGAVTWTP